jgi:twinkle protein
VVEQKDNNTFIGDNWDELGFDLKGRDNAARDIKVRCPQCSDSRKNTQEPCVSIRPLDGVANCKNCGSVFLIRKEREVFVKPKQVATPLKPANLTALSDAGLELFRNRRISQEAIKIHMLVEKNGYICFPYIYNKQLVAAKYRKIEEKAFYAEQGGYHILYNYDNAMAAVLAAPKGQKKLIINEGEFDALAWETVGIPFNTSVDNGAPNPADRSVEGKLECITNSMELIDAAEIVYVGTDMDENGKLLQKELIRRIGPEKCKIIDYSPYKDANEYLLYEGKDKLRGLIELASDPKVSGIFTADEFHYELMDLYTNGISKGSTTYMPTIDQAWTWRLQEVNLWTGYNNDGKSKLLRYLEMLKAKYDSWKVALFVPEDMPMREFLEDMCHMYIGKPLDPDSPIRATLEEVYEAEAFLKEYFHVVYPKEAFTLDELFAKFAFLVRKKGVRIIDIDPYNTVEHQYARNETTDLYISRFMGKVKRFAIDYDVAFNVVAHQNPPDKVNEDKTYPPPRKYRIKGGGTFSDKTDNVLGVWRPRRQIDFKDPTVTFISDKIKKMKYTGQADLQVDIQYDYFSNRYLDPLLSMKSPMAIPLNFY